MSLKFINPYNFVRANGEPGRRRPEFHHTLAADTYSGELVCKLEVKTRLLIPDSMSIEEPYGPKNHKIFHDFAKRTGPNGQTEYIIPATSLKGVVRSVAEALSNSCFSVFDTSFEYTIKYPNNKKYTQGNLDKKLASDSCDDVSKLCPACRIFGMVANKQNGEIGNNNPSGFRGKVMFEDAIEKNVCFEDKEFFLQLSSPRPHNWRFYLTPEMEYLDYESAYDSDTKIRGRKFYYHFEPKPLTDRIFKSKDEQKTKKNVTVKKTVLPESTFTFNVAFTNLTEDELGLLIFALELEDGLAHKIGMGKPVGFGSCKISFVQGSNNVYLAQERYRDLGEPAPLSLQEIRDIKGTYLRKIETNTERNESYDDLKAILRLERSSSIPVKYPSGQREMEEVRQKVLGDISEVEDGNYFVDPPVSASAGTKKSHSGQENRGTGATIRVITGGVSRNSTEEKKKIAEGTELVVIVQSIEDSKVHYRTKDGLAGHCEEKYGITLHKGDKIKVRVTVVAPDGKTITKSVLIRKI